MHTPFLPFLAQKRAQPARPLPGQAAMMCKKLFITTCCLLCSRQGKEDNQAAAGPTKRISQECHQIGMHCALFCKDMHGILDMFCPDCSSCVWIGPEEQGLRSITYEYSFINTVSTCVFLPCPRAGPQSPGTRKRRPGDWHNRKNIYSRIGTDPCFHDSKTRLCSALTSLVFCQFKNTEYSFNCKKLKMYL